jgi:hypothetical protein
MKGDGELSGGPSPEPYVVLSYCWGGDQPIRCTSATLDTLIQGIESVKLPKTLQDAAEVCWRLGFRYLWIDALCIIQDDEKDKMTEIAQMARVYGNAVLTIAATSAASVTQGFLHSRKFPLEADESLEVAVICPDGQRDSVVLIESLPNNVESGVEPLDLRGWTFQERLLSSRMLSFGTYQLDWICLSVTKVDKCAYIDGWGYGDPSWRDSPLAGKLGPLLPRSQRGWAHRLLYLMEAWNSVLVSFTSRKLTVPEDRALAISGVAETFGTSMNSTYMAGLWQEFFPYCLLWFDVAKPGQSPRPRSYQGPSWSWTSINSQIMVERIDPELPNNNACKLLRYERVLAIENAPFGALRPGTARLWVKGQIILANRVTWLDNESRQTPSSSHQFAELLLDSDEDAAIYASSWCDPDGDTVALILVAESHDTSYGLILKRAHGESFTDTFSRMGFWTYNHDRDHSSSLINGSPTVFDGSEKETESSECHHEEIGTHVKRRDLFGDAEYAVIQLI